MGRTEIEDPKLAEVRAILARLQRMDADEEFDARAPRLSVSPRQVVDPSQAAAAVSAQPLQVAAATASVEALSSMRLTVSVLAVSAVAAVVFFSISSLWMPGLTPAPDAPAAMLTKVGGAAGQPAKSDDIAAPLSTAVIATIVDKRDVESSAVGLDRSDVATATAPGANRLAIEGAERLIRAGAVVAGREELLRLAALNSVDAAWALARSFDPNVVGDIANADARPDVDAAGKWYQEWHARAIRQGLVADSIPVDRIIRSMRR